MKISNNLAYSWWVHPIAVREAGTDNFLYGGVMSDGNPRVFRKQPSDTVIADIENRILFDATEADDHNSVSILSAVGKPLLVFWQRHGKSPYINFWEAPEGTFNFGDKRRIEFSSNVTYCQLMTIGDRIVLITRKGSSYWHMMISEDWGATWSDESMFFDGSSYGGQIYCTTKPLDTDDTKFHLAAYGHPLSSPWRDVGYASIDLVSGEVSNFAGVVGNIYTDLPIVPADLDIVWQPQGTNGEKVRLLDVGDKHGTPAVLLGKWNNNTLTPQYYVAHQDTTTGLWTNFKYRSSGGSFWAYGAQNYTYGMAFDRNGNDWLYMGTKDSNGSYSMRKFTVNADFTLSNEQVLHNATVPLARPYPIDKMNGVVYQALIQYNSFVDYDINLHLRQ